MNNSMFEKATENERNPRDLKLLMTDRRSNKLTSKYKQKISQKNYY